MASCVPAELVNARVTSDENSTSPRDNLPNPDSSSVQASGPRGVNNGIATATQDRPTSSVFSRDDNAPVHVVPMRVIHRPLPSELDEAKVQAFMEEMKAGDVFTPIEVVKVRAPLKNDPTRAPQNFYFAMGGCHRYEATKRLGLESIRAKIIEVPASNMRIYLGSGCPF